MSPSEREQLSRLFGSYKAEWLQDRIFEFFTEPTYFPELKQPNPCVLEGGRGTGKTTVLRGLSYEGQWSLQEKPTAFITDLQFIGIYYRVDTNRVTAFRGPGLTEQEWQRHFAHYLNMVFAELIVRFICWSEKTFGLEVQIAPEDAKLVAIALNIDSFECPSELAQRIREAKILFESRVNNLDSEGQYPLTLQGVPLEVLINALWQNPAFSGKQVFFLIDEYENLLDAQQQVVNTLMKHTTPLFTFKIGVRQEGWRCRTALNSHEVLRSPADYVLLEIANELKNSFGDFTMNVCNARLRGMNAEISDVRRLLPALSLDEEAEELGVLEKIGPVLDKISTQTGVCVEEIRSSTSALNIYFLEGWAAGNNQSIGRAWLDFKEDESSWSSKLQNYRYACLFAIRQGKRGIHKYYCGWDTYVTLAHGNIRYIMELVHQSLLAHLNDEKTLATPIAFDCQTKTAQAVGRKNLSELEGLSTEGNSLVRMLLGLGRIFQVMAGKPFGHTPEVNHFHVRPEETTDHAATSRLDSLLKEGVMHLAFIRSYGNKLAHESDVRAYDYMIHPIFCAFFEYSHRRKRKLALSEADILGLIDNPSATIDKILKEQNRVLSDAELPEQMTLLGDFYGS
jgi:hypothetical protein